LDIGKSLYSALGGARDTRARGHAAARPSSPVFICGETVQVRQERKPHTFGIAILIFLF
jgi:hypothetical protein